MTITYCSYIKNTLCALLLSSLVMPSPLASAQDGHQTGVGSSTTASAASPEPAATAQELNGVFKKHRERAAKPGQNPQIHLYGYKAYKAKAEADYKVSFTMK